MVPAGPGQFPLSPDIGLARAPPSAFSLLTSRQPRLSTHSQWVVFLVVVVVAITGIWIGSCVWRKHYLAKKDRQYALGKGLARATESGRVVPNTSAGSVHVPGAGIFNPAPIGSAGVYDGEKVRKEKKKWVVTERT